MTMELQHQPAPAAGHSKDRRLPKLSAERWFVDHTFIPDDYVDDIWQQCDADGALPLISRHPRFGWVFHTLCRKGVIISKPIADEFPLDSTPQLTEREIEDRICDYLESKGIQYQRQVPCEIGIADVVTDSTVYELKLSVAGSMIFMAIGQAQAYRAALGVARAAILTVRPPLRAVQIGDLLGVAVLDHDEAATEGHIR